MSKVKKYCPNCGMKGCASSLYFRKEIKCPNCNKIGFFLDKIKHKHLKECRNRRKKNNNTLTDSKILALWHRYNRSLQFNSMATDLLTLEENELFNRLQKKQSQTINYINKYVAQKKSGCIGCIGFIILVPFLFFWIGILSKKKVENTKSIHSDATFLTDPNRIADGIKHNCRLLNDPLVNCIGVGDRYCKKFLIDASSCDVTITLPYSPCLNDRIVFEAVDTTHAITFARNGNNINGFAKNLKWNTDGVRKMIFTNKGWVIRKLPLVVDNLRVHKIICTIIPLTILLTMAIMTHRNNVNRKRNSPKLKNKILQNMLSSQEKKMLAELKNKIRKIEKNIYNEMVAAEKHNIIPEEEDRVQHLHYHVHNHIYAPTPNQCMGCGGRKMERKNGFVVCAHCGGVIR